MTYLLFLFLAVHLTYYLLIFIRLAIFSNQLNKVKKRLPLSIVVCFKNEDENVDKLLRNLMRQNADEIVLVDDFSSDETLSKLQSYQSNKITVIRASSDKPGKKQAAQDGVSAAENNRILFTDADCIPATERWAELMNTNDKPVILGYSPMMKTSGWVNLFARFETYMTGVQYLSYALAGMPYMGVGRNMLIDKTLRDTTKIKGQHLASGDDDLTVNAVANSKNTAICIHPDSFVFTDSATTLSGFIRQKTRHISTSVHYKLVHQLMLGAFSASQILFYVMLICGLIVGTIPVYLGIIAYAAKQVVQILIHSALIKKMKESIPIHHLLLLDLLLFLYYLLMPFILLIRKNDNHWS